MTEVNQRTKVTRTRELTVSTGPWGAAYVEVSKAFSIASQQLQELGLSRSDNTITVHPGDDEIIIRYTIEERYE